MTLFTGKQWLTFLTLLLLLGSLFNPSHAKPFKVKNCSAAATREIDWAVDFINQHIDTMLARARFIPTKYHSKIKKKWPKSTIKCTTKGSCKKATVGGFHRLGNNIKLCWDNLVDQQVTRCGLVGVIMHEKAHAANVPIEKKHNSTREYSYIRNIDLVYRFDAVVQDVCDNPPAVSTGSSGGDALGAASSAALGLGEYCSKNNQCGSGKCNRGECVCARNSDCGDGFRCKKRIGKNYCIATGADLGDFCKRNSDCGIGVCQKKSCVCKRDTDCRTSFNDNNWRCQNRVGKNYCQGINLPRGGACKKNSDCNSGKCKRKVCR